MAAKIATDEVVFLAADALVAEGEEPTTTLLRERTGGSFTTLGPALARWKALRASERQEPVPVEVASKVDQLARSIWNAARAKAESGLADARQAAERSIQSAASELAEAQDEITRLEAELGSLARERAADRDALARERSHAEAQALRLQRMEAECDRHGDALEHARQEAQHHLVRAAALDGECDALKKQLVAMLQAISSGGTARARKHARE